MRRAFTLIELLIVVAIIGILAAIAVPNFLGARIRAKVAQAQADMRTISTALEMYRLDYNTYTTWATDSNDWRGMKQLTTPISYISSPSALKNPFIDERRVTIGGNTANGSEIDSYYELGTWIKRGNTYQHNYPNNVWLLESAGPDQGDDYNRGIFPRRGLVYHVSNGMLSRGDIYRAGGVFVPDWVSESL